MWDRFKRRFWHPEFLGQDRITGEELRGPERFLRRFEPVVDHWLRHWQFWIGLALNAVGIYIAYRSLLAAQCA